MCNCGKKRNELRQQSNSFNANVQSNTQAITQQKGSASFQYIGNTGLTVTGNVNRRNYRFNFPGDIQSIELNDASALSAVPVLKRIT